MKRYFLIGSYPKNEFVFFIFTGVYEFLEKMWFLDEYTNSYDLVKTIEGYGNADSGTPVAEITITNCEQLR